MLVCARVCVQVTSLCVPLPKHGTASAIGGWGGTAAPLPLSSAATTDSLLPTDAPPISRTSSSLIDSSSGGGGGGGGGPLRRLSASDLTRFPRVTLLDVSQHALTSLRSSFTPSMPIVDLNLSHNSIRSLGRWRGGVE
jgi:hypothetical protein